MAVGTQLKSFSKFFSYDRELPIPNHDTDTDTDTDTDNDNPFHHLIATALRLIMIITYILPNDVGARALCSQFAQY